MKTLIISGLSGAGKSKAASYLEDAGDYIVEGKIPKLSVANIQQVLEYVKKANALITALFSA